MLLIWLLETLLPELPEFNLLLLKNQCNIHYGWENNLGRQFQKLIQKRKLK